MAKHKAISIDPETLEGTTKEREDKLAGMMKEMIKNQQQVENLLDSLANSQQQLISSIKQLQGPSGPSSMSFSQSSPLRSPATPRPRPPMDQAPAAPLFNSHPRPTIGQLPQAQSAIQTIRLIPSIRKEIDELRPSRSLQTCYQSGREACNPIGQ
eukprot:Gb_14485 [translate_table: standard]